MSESTAPGGPGFDPTAVHDHHSPRVRHILDEARAMLRESGWRGVSMRRLAARLDVKAPSLYKHITGKNELYRLLLDETLRNLGTALHASIAEEPCPRLLLRAYREAASADPHGYRLISRSRVVNMVEPTELDRWIREPFTRVTGGDEARGLALWAFAHGLVTAELVQDSGSTADPVWLAGADAFAPPRPAQGE